MFLVVTSIALKDGALDACLDLFKRINPELVAEQEDWVGVEFTVDREANAITVIARWKNPASYRSFAASERFKSAVAAFADYFDGRPDVRIVERVWQMGRLA